MKLGIKLKKMREAAGLTQRDISDALGWETPQLVSNNERSISYPPLSCLSKLAELLKCDEVEFKKMVMHSMVEEYKADLKSKMGF